MADRILPTREEAEAIVPVPGSVIWRYAGDARLLATAGYALLLQVSHPTVGAGVSEHSEFKKDPWGRLLRTLDYTYSMVYGGPRLASEVGGRVREMHKHIKGVKPDGERYHALEPEAYAWVHATLVDSIILGHRQFGRHMPVDEIERFYAGWRRNGRLVGVRESDLPEGWAAFREYFDRMVAERLENTESVQDVLATLSSPATPPLPFLGDGVWKVARVPAARSLDLTTIGLLPPVLRERFGLEWTASHERRFRALSRASRAATPLMPKALRNMGPGYLRWRRKALERGDVAAAPAAPSRSITRAA